jgi:hypothetical protein
VTLTPSSRRFVLLTVISEANPLAVSSASKACSRHAALFLPGQIPLPFR